MIYTAREQNSTFVPTPAFKTRNLNLAPAKLLDLNIFTKPHRVQVAYGDYKHNIEAFCYATSIKESVLIGAKHFPFSNSYVPTSPFGLPKTVFKIDESKNISAGNRAMLLKAVEKMSGTVKDLGGKAGTVYLLDKPIFSAIRSTLPQIMHQRPPFVAGYASAPASLAATTLIQFLEAFMATHTYEYRGEDATDRLSTSIPPGTKRKATTGLTRRAHTQKKKKAGKGKEKAEGMEVDEPEVEEAVETPTPTLGMTAQAKASPLPASTNWGTISEIPTKKGIFFPYFNGMLIPDITALRSLASELYFHNLPGPDVHSAWKAYRELLPSLSQCEKGQVYIHALFGCKLALEAQCRVFFIFESKEYGGFVLLGEHFSAYVGNVEHRPQDPEVWKQEVSAHIETVEASIERIVSEFARMEISVVGMDNADTLYDAVCVALSKIDVKAPELAPGVERIQSALSNWMSKVDFVQMTQKSLVDSMGSILASRLSPDTPRPTVYYIAKKDWIRMTDPLYAYLAAHGPTSFSLRNAKGESFPLHPLTKRYDIPAALTKEDKKSGTKKVPQNHLYFYEKVVLVALTDMQTLMEKGSVVQDGAERAGANRAIVLKKESEVSRLLGYFSNAQHIFKEVEGGLKKDFAEYATEEAGVVLDEAGEIQLVFDFVGEMEE